MSTATEAPAQQIDPAPAGDAPPAAPAPQPALPPVDPPAPPAASSDPASVADLGDGPDGDPVEGETPEQKLKRIARRADKERQAAERDRDAAAARAEAAEAQLSESTNVSQELAEANTRLTTLTQEHDQAKLTILKYEVGAAAGLTMAQSVRLMGTTRDELDTDAKQFIADNAMPGSGSARQPLVNDEQERQHRVEIARRRRN